MNRHRLREFHIHHFVFCRMDLLAGIALYEDIAMYEHAATSRYINNLSNTFIHLLILLVTKKSEKCGIRQV
jgi:hypothetical protein